MIAVGYTRRSKKSEEKTISLEEQRLQIESYCLANNFILKEVIQHDGISGTNRKRFEEIKKTIADSGACVVVCYHLDRLGRDVGGLLDFLRGLAVEGIEVHSVDAGKVDLRKSSGFVVTAVKGVFDELFPILVSEKTSDALRRKRDRGLRYTNLPPFGFDYSNGKLVESDHEQTACRVIADCRSLGFGARKTRKALIQSGYNGRMGLATLHRLLHSLPPKPYGVVAERHQARVLGLDPSPDIGLEE